LETRVPARLTPGEGRRFGFTVGAAFLALGGLMWWREHTALAQVIGTIGALLSLAAAVIPGRLGPVHDTWMGFATAISRVTTPIILGVIYFTVLTPTGVLRRLFGRNPVKPSAEAASFWVAREPSVRRRRDMEHQF
jgi:hypothetical protein